MCLNKRNKIQIENADSCSVDGFIPLAGANYCLGHTEKTQQTDKTLFEFSNTFLHVNILLQAQE